MASAPYPYRTTYNPWVPWPQPPSKPRAGGQSQHSPLDAGRGEKYRPDTSRCEPTRVGHVRPRSRTEHHPPHARPSIRSGLVREKEMLAEAPRKGPNSTPCVLRYQPPSARRGLDLSQLVFGSILRNFALTPATKTEARESILNRFLRHDSRVPEPIVRSNPSCFYSLLRVPRHYICTYLFLICSAKTIPGI